LFFLSPVVRDGEIYDERYFLGHDASKKWMSFSASKLLVGLLTAIAHEKGQIDDLDDPLSKYAPQFKETAWENVTFTQALNMTSGVRWNENDLSLTSDLIRFGVMIAFRTTFDEFLAGMEPAPWKVGVQNYSSMDTQALGAAVSGATGMSLSRNGPLWAYLSEGLVSVVRKTQLVFPIPLTHIPCHLIGNARAGSVEFQHLKWVHRRFSDVLVRRCRKRGYVSLTEPRRQNIWYRRLRIPSLERPESTPARHATPISRACVGFRQPTLPGFV
jgi:hypothetical protein